MNNRRTPCGGFRGREDAATTAEYAIMIGFLALTCAAAVRALWASVVVPFVKAIVALT